MSEDQPLTTVGASESDAGKHSWSQVLGRTKQTEEGPRAYKLKVLVL